MTRKTHDDDAPVPSLEDVYERATGLAALATGTARGPDYRLALPLDPDVPRQWCLLWNDGKTFAADTDYSGLVLTIEIMSQAEAELVTRYLETRRLAARPRT